ncbi:gamma-glutamylcyclotransferase family protein [Aminipila luticellarii]|uniref:Gamma-glutamylcyclotransferase n=1 Tax=Aminipila luticellarii TaxID=2507160 RepID=A0A410PVN1_9FIRM|nr:gamma-glutamylcyclotransferase family protein [Aminipila luticellarii]QAT42987.1 gamma-glutamylcyclotransferase [Aminipila luticellarii]
MLYIAYGSNISKNRMRERCPGARFITKGIVDNCTLQFHYKADIIPVHDYELPVVVWDIPESEVPNLDRAEGYPKHYSKEQLEVSPVPPLNFEQLVELVGVENVRKADDYGVAEIIGTAYAMTDWKKTEWKEHSKQTTIEYAEHIITGYKEQGFDGWHLHDLWYALCRGEKSPESRS